jgi:transcriptional regulator with XRE-family HTH domain
VPVPAVSAQPASVAAPAELGLVLRAARRTSGLKLREAAARAGTSPTTLSLLERGRRAVPPDVLERIAEITGAQVSEVFRLAGTMPSQAAADVLGRELSSVLAGGGLSRPARRALRRVHLAAIAARIATSSGLPPVDAEGLLEREFGIELRAVEDMSWARFETAELIEYASVLDGDGQRSERALVLGHMAGHALLARESQRRPQCSHTAGGTGEAEATWLAGLLLMPRPMLESEAQLLASTYPASTREGLFSFVAAVADAFAVPAWMAASHLADAGQLAWAAGQEEP